MLIGSHLAVMPLQFRERLLCEHRDGLGAVGRELGRKRPQFLKVVNIEEIGEDVIGRSIAARGLASGGQRADRKTVARCSTRSGIVSRPAVTLATLPLWMMCSGGKSALRSTMTLSLGK